MHSTPALRAAVDDDASPVARDAIRSLDASKIR